MTSHKTIAIIGCGPAGLMAANVLAEAGITVNMFDSMPSAGRKFIVAGKGGLNLSNAEKRESFLMRYGENSQRFARFLDAFSQEDLCNFLCNIGVETFIGNSGRIFPKEAKAPSILKNWLKKLERLGVIFHFHHKLQGFDPDSNPTFLLSDGSCLSFSCDACILALGGASWPQTGSDGSWVSLLRKKDIDCKPFRPANCGVEVEWSEYFRTHFAGKPLKNLHLQCGETVAKGEAVITVYGLEGGGIYLLSKAIRDTLEKKCPAILMLDLKKDLSEEQILNKLLARNPKETLSNCLKKTLKLSGPSYSLLRELCTPGQLSNPSELAQCIKMLPVPVTKTRPLVEAISSAGGISFAEVNNSLMLRKLPGVFVAGEMLDWEAPTGGYLLQGAFSTGFYAASGLLQWLQTDKKP